MTPKFTVAQVLSLYQDRLYCSFDEQRALIDHMVGEHVPLWDLPTVIPSCQKSLGRQYPWLKSIGTAGPYRGDTHARYVRAAAHRAGADEMHVRTLRPGSYQRRELEAVL